MKISANHIGVSIITLLLLCGCARTTRDFDEAESRNPLLKKALAEERAGDVDRAVLSLRQALNRNPTIALGHLRIALLYDDHLEDYARAIYHYQRYLELRPDTEKKEMISDRIGNAEVLFCANLTGRLMPVGTDCSAIMKENARLQRELRQVRRNLAELSAAVAVKPPPEGDEAFAAPHPGVEDATISEVPGRDGRRYIVQQNDTLSRIAAKMYENPRAWRRIYEANRDVLGDDPGVLTVGQELIIPE